MSDKRYFKRMWEEEYYIFDSEIISENEFDEKLEYEDYQAFADSMLGDEVVNKLNQLNDENKQLEHRLAISEKANFVTALAKENEQLKAQLKDCEYRITDKEVEWLRNNTVWEQMPSNKRTFITTSAKEDYK